MEVPMSRLGQTSLEPLEPYDGKLSSTVLRGESPRKGADLLDVPPNGGKLQTISCKKTKNMKQKNYIIKLLLKTWLGILCFSLLCTFCAVWLLFQNTKQSSYDNINIVYEGILLTWAIIGVIMFSVGTFTLFLNYFPVIRYNNIYSFLSFFLVPMLLILLCGTEILCLWTVKIPFIVCLSGAYLLFRNKIKNTANNAG